MILLGIGAGMAFNPVLLAAMSDVAPEESGLASGVVNTAFMMGGALGLAVLASVAASRTDSLQACRPRHLAALDRRLPRWRSSSAPCSPPRPPRSAGRSCAPACTPRRPTADGARPRERARSPATATRSSEASPRRRPRQRRCFSASGCPGCGRPCGSSRRRHPERVAPPWTTSVGTPTASSSARRLFSGRPGGWSGNARQMTATESVSAAVGTRRGRPRSGRRSGSGGRRAGPRVAGGRPTSRPRRAESPERGSAAPRPGRAARRARR